MANAMVNAPLAFNVSASSSLQTVGGLRSLYPKNPSPCPVSKAAIKIGDGISVQQDKVSWWDNISR